jgi:hypothetical protein
MDRACLREISVVGMHLWVRALESFLFIDTSSWSLDNWVLHLPAHLIGRCWSKFGLGNVVKFLSAEIEASAWRKSILDKAGPSGGSVIGGKLWIHIYCHVSAFRDGKIKIRWRVGCFGMSLEVGGVTKPRGWCLFRSLINSPSCSGATVFHWRGWVCEWIRWHHGPQILLLSSRLRKIMLVVLKYEKATIECVACRIRRPFDAERSLLVHCTVITVIHIGPFLLTDWLNLLENGTNIKNGVKVLKFW